MMRNRTVFPSDHAGWIAYLDRGRYKTKTFDRPIGSSRTKRVHRFANGDVGLRYHATYCVIFHADGTVTYDTGGWHTITTKQFINAHGPTRVWSDKGQLFLPVHNPSYTPAKVQKCRVCHGKAVLPASCYGPRYCYAAYGGRQCVHGETSQHRLNTCPHGKTEGHPVPDIACYRCDGTGKRDYGSKPIHFEWTGSAYRFHPDDVEHGTYPGNLSGSVATSVNYSQAGNALTRLIPGLDERAASPCDCPYPEGNTFSIRENIIHLNDTHHPDREGADVWTRERIADWLETLDVDLRFPTPAE